MSTDFSKPRLLLETYQRASKMNMFSKNFGESIFKNVLSNIKFMTPLELIEFIEIFNHKEDIICKYILNNEGVQRDFILDAQNFDIYQLAKLINIFPKEEQVGSYLLKMLIVKLQ